MRQFGLLEELVVDNDSSGDSARRSREDRRWSAGKVNQIRGCARRSAQLNRGSNLREHESVIRHRVALFQCNRIPRDQHHGIGCDIIKQHSCRTTGAVDYRILRDRVRTCGEKTIPQSGSTRALERSCSCRSR